MTHRDQTEVCEAVVGSGEGCGVHVDGCCEDEVGDSGEV